MPSLPVSFPPNALRGQKVHGIVKFFKLFLFKSWISSSHAEHENSQANLFQVQPEVRRKYRAKNTRFVTGAIEAKFIVVANFSCSSI